IMRITGISQPHRAFRQSADAKLTVPHTELEAGACAARPPSASAKYERLRLQRVTSPAIARQLDMPDSTTTKILRRLGLNRLTMGLASRCERGLRTEG